MRSDHETEAIEVEGEVLAEEDADFDAAQDSYVQVLERRANEDSLPILRDEVRTAAIAVAGGAIAGAATIAAVRAVSHVGRNGRRPDRRLGRKRRNDNIVASRSFLVDVHVLGR